MNRVTDSSPTLGGGASQVALKWQRPNILEIRYDSSARVFKMNARVGEVDKREPSTQDIRAERRDRLVLTLFGRVREPLRLEKISSRASDGYFPIKPSPGYVYSRLATEFSSVVKHVQIRFDMPDGRLVDGGFWLRGRCGSEFGHSHVRYGRQDWLAA
jgi:hypothetical protein